MSIYPDPEKMTASIQSFIDSDTGKAYFNKIKIAQENKIRRFNQFGEWLKSNDIDSYFYRVLNKHDEEYREKCYHKGFEPNPNNVLQFIIDYAFVYGTPVDEKKKKKLKIDSTFANNVAYFMGYYFQIVYGQGCFYRIYNEDDMRILITL